MSVIERLSSEGATLFVIVDPSGTPHYAYTTARRTLCLDVVTADCRETHELEGRLCPICESTRRKLSRRRRDWHELGSDARAPVAR
jgi:hypothetical protein